MHPYPASARKPPPSFSPQAKGEGWGGVLLLLLLGL